MHANLLDAGTHRSSWLLCIGPEICFCHQTRKGSPGKAAVLPCLLLCSQPLLSTQAPQYQKQAEDRFSPFLSSLPLPFPPSLPQNEHSKPQQLDKSSLPASLMHVDSHLSCPAVMEPGLRASLRRIHAPKSIKICVSKGGDSIFLTQLNGSVRLRVCLRCVGRRRV